MGVVDDGEDALPGTRLEDFVRAGAQGEKSGQEEGDEGVKRLLYGRGKCSDEINGCSGEPRTFRVDAVVEGAREGANRGDGFLRPCRCIASE